MQQQLRVCLQARIVAYSDSDEEDFKPKKWQAGTGSESDSEDKPSPVDHNTSEVNVKQRQLIRRPPPGNKVSIEAGPSMVAVAGFCGQHVTPKVERLLVPQTVVRVTAQCDACCDCAAHVNAHNTTCK